jgi:N-acetylmuramoyl-L-alanine amidase
MIKAIIFILITISSLHSYAKSNLLKINYISLSKDTHQIIFTFDGKTRFYINNANIDKVKIDFINSKLSLKKTTNLDNKFISKIEFYDKDEFNNLRINLNLSKNTILRKSFSSNNAGEFFVTLEFHHKPDIPKLFNFPSLRTRYVIVIDPGHGGIDCGTFSLSGRLEKNIVLDYAKALAQELLKYPEYKVLLTRDKDMYLSLNERKIIAQKAKANLFISLHVDSNQDQFIHGASVYTLSQDSMNIDDLLLCDKENNAELFKKDSSENQQISNMLFGMVYEDTQNSSIKFADLVVQELSKEVDMLDNSSRLAGFNVLKVIDVPSVLVELGYLSNKQEETLLDSYIHKKRLIKGLVQGINKYFTNYEN